jgi:rfaE bifunctional protein kinase chain/domain
MLGTLTEEKLNQFFRQMKGKTIAVIGDLMIDKYIWGNVTRISPEAPVPVVEVTEESQRLGGAANVGNNIITLGGKCFLVGVVGNDSHAAVMRNLIEDLKMDASGLITDSSRMTTVKTRVIAQQQHVVRIDHEQKHDIASETVDKIVSFLEKNIDQIDGIILEDYNKGVLTKELIHRVIELSNRHKKIIAVDPKLNNFFEYKNVTVFKPNLKETAEGLNRKVKSEEEVISAGRELLGKLQAKHVLITRSEKGMSLFSGNDEYYHVPTKAIEVADVSGAGDTVIAALTLALAAGIPAPQSAELANLAGGLVVGEVGIIPAEPNKIINFWKRT